jgi:hypothetical protein
VSKALCVPKGHSALELPLFIEITTDLDLTVDKYLQNTLAGCVFISKGSLTRVRKTHNNSKDDKRNVFFREILRKLESSLWN